jgi:mono/diheme cytochrome c family protein
MRSKLLIAIGLLLLTMGLFVGIAGAQDDAVIQGGLLYDEWWNVTGADEPTTDHPLWATQSTNTRSGPDTWRCKECHGWDYKGAEGAYGSGSHATGFPGVYDARTKSVDDLVAALKGGTNPDHDFSTVMDDEALTNLATFIQNVMDYSQYIDYSTKAPIGGDATNGQALFSEKCALCHGADGTTFNFGSDEEPEYVGTVAADNPQEFLHKALYGQPGSQPRMIAGLENGWTIDQVVDVLAYAQSLPTGAEAMEEMAAEEPAALPATGGVPLDASVPLILSGAILLGAGLLSRRKG